MSSRSLTSIAAVSAANWRSLVCAMPSSSGSAMINPPSHCSRSTQSPIVLGVAGPGVCLSRLNGVVALPTGFANNASSAAASWRVRLAATRPKIRAWISARSFPTSRSRVLNAGRSMAAACKASDRPVDEVGGVTHGFGRLEEGAGQQALGCFAIGHDAEVGPDRGMVAIELAQPAHVIGQRGRRLQAELRGDMRHDASMNFARCRKETEILAGLQQHRQQKAAIVAARIGAHEGQIRLGQVVAKAEFVAAQPRSRTRVGGAVDGCHDASGKGCAGSAGGSV